MNWHSPGSRKSGTKEVATFYISRQPWKVIATWFFFGMNSVNGWILHSKKIQSESSEEIIPALEEKKRRCGEPLAIKRYIRQGMALAVSEVFPNKPDKICHFHFSLRSAVMI